jgi:hypothetical protein
LLLILHGQRTPQDGIEDREHGHSQSDAKCKRDERGCSETGIAPTF